MNESNKTARRDFTNIVLNEDFKEFLFKQIKTAHDFRGDGHISSLLHRPKRKMRQTFYKK